MFGFGKKKKLHEAARQSISQFHGTIQPLSDEDIGLLLVHAEAIKFDMALSNTAQEAPDVFEKFFTNPFSLPDQQLNAMLDWSRDILKQMMGQMQGERAGGIMVWISNGMCAAHTDLIPLGQALWVDLVRGKPHAQDFDWNRYSIGLKQFGVQLD